MVILDVTGISTVTDYFVIASADNRVQLRAIADNTLALLRAGGIQPHHVEGYDDSGWILVDCGDVVVHYFLEERREFYALERLWGDSARVEFLSSASPNDAREGKGCKVT